MKDEYYCIEDENGMFTYGDGIKKCGKKFYYNPTNNPDRGYNSEENALKALKCLELHNKLGKLNHKFKIVIK
jgi:hypothetical protein